MNLTPLQILGIIMVVNSAMIGATAQLTQMFGATVANDIVSIASLGNAILSGVLTMLSGQGSMIKSVAAMPGVEKITVNSQANQALAQIAVSNAPEAVKVQSTPSAEAKVEQTAKGN